MGADCRGTNLCRTFGSTVILQKLLNSFPPLTSLDAGPSERVEKGDRLAPFIRPLPDQELQSMPVETLGLIEHTDTNRPRSVDSHDLSIRFGTWLSVPQTLVDFLRQNVTGDNQTNEMRQSRTHFPDSTATDVIFESQNHQANPSIRIDIVTENAAFGMRYSLETGPRREFHLVNVVDIIDWSIENLRNLGRVGFKHL